MGDAPRVNLLTTQSFFVNIEKSRRRLQEQSELLKKLREQLKRK
jgi:hypothetical protein